MERAAIDQPAVDQPVITPLPLGLFTVPGREVAKYPGVVIRSPYVVCAYLVRTPSVTLLFDTGIVGTRVRWRVTSRGTLRSTSSSACTVWSCATSTSS